MVKIANSIVLLCVVLCIAMFPAAIRAADPIRIGITESPPLTTAEREDYGIVPAIVTAAFKKVNTEAEYRVFPSARAFEIAKRGEVDATCAWVWSEEREKFFHYSEPIFKGPLVFFHLKSFKFDWETMDDVKGIQIGIVARNYYGPDFHEALDAGKLEFQEVFKKHLNLHKLMGGRIKLVPLNLYMGYDMAKKDFTPEKMEQLTHHPKPLKTSVYHLLFSKALAESESMVKLFNQGLQQLKGSGEYDKLLKDSTLITP